MLSAACKPSHHLSSAAQFLPLACAFLAALALLSFVPGGAVEFPEPDPYITEGRLLLEEQARVTDSLKAESRRALDRMDLLEVGLIQIQLHFVCEQQRYEREALRARHGRQVPVTR
jgi:hypothetical protein